MKEDSDYNKMLKMSITRTPRLKITLFIITYLDLSNNKISSTNNMFSFLPSLKILDLSQNEIENVAFDIGTLNNLYNLSLAHNKIRDLPNDIRKLKNLQYLSIQCNPLNLILANTIGPIESSKTQCRLVAAKTVRYLRLRDEHRIQEELIDALFREVGFFQRLIFNIIAYTVMIFIVANALRFYNENEYNECKTIILSIWSWFTKYLDMPQLQK